MIKDRRLSRTDATRLRVENPQGVDATLFATDDVPVEAEAVDELLGLLALQETVRRLAEESPDFFGGVPPAVAKVAVTPDFHKAAGIPVGTVLATKGFVVPQAVGNDINCGMRLHTTALDADRVRARLDPIETRSRHLFFEGGRDIPMTRRQREALFRDGLLGLLDAVPKTQQEGIWSLLHARDTAGDLDRIESVGSLPAGRVWGLDDFLGPQEVLTRDSQIGSIGGGNHFVEVQVVERILDGAVAHAWGLRAGQVTVMVHTGSVGIGHLCGTHYRQVVRDLFPAHLRHPANGVYVLPEAGEEGDPRHRAAFALFWDALHNAANFAFANRMFLALLALRALREGTGATNEDDDPFPLLYDAPHNLVWRAKDADSGEPIYLHRKGACPAGGFDAMAGTPYAYEGQPVLVPGSMGAPSFVLVGQGSADALWSASHGAGRALSRGAAQRAVGDADLAAFLRAFRVVTPLDLRRPDLRGRRDILDRKLQEIKQEAPWAYKGILPIIDTLTRAGIARPVAELKPLLTVKG